MNCGTADLPMEVKGEAVGGRAEAAHVGCCVFLCLCFCCCASGLLATKTTYFVESQYIGLAKMANFCTLVDKNE